MASTLTSPMRNADPEALWQVSWHEGLQLLPQHFQLLERRIEAMARTVRADARAYLWGFTELEFDRGAALEGRIALERACGAFQDGTAFAYEGRLQEPLELRLDPPSATGQPVIVALAVPALDFREYERTVSRMLIATGNPISDIDRPDEHVTVLRRRLNLQLRHWDPADRRWEQLPLVELAPNATGYRITEFHPPALHLLANTALLQDVKDAISALRSRAALYIGKGVRGRVARDRHVCVDWIFGQLCSDLPWLETSAQAGVWHPYEAFKDLCRLYGRLGSLIGELPDRLLAYDHLRPSDALHRLLRRIDSALALLQGAKQEQAELPFEKAPGLWRVTLPQSLSTETPLLCAAELASDASDDVFARWVDTTLITTADQVDSCRQRRVKGLARVLVSQHAEISEDPNKRVRLFQVGPMTGAPVAGHELIIGDPPAGLGLNVVALRLRLPAAER